MTAWTVAILIASAITWLQYGSASRGPASLAALALRWVAVLILSALLLGAPAGRPKQPSPIIALDASASWLRGGDSSAWKQALRQAASRSSEQLVLFGDSTRVMAGDPTPGDRNSLVRPVVDRALAAARPLVVLTDGIIDDPEALNGLPAGSRVDVSVAGTFADLAGLAIEAPRSAVSGDTIEVAVTVASGAVRTSAASIVVRAGATVLDTIGLDPLAPFSERRLTMRVAPGGNGPTVITAIARMPGDREPRNDTVSTVVEITRGAAAVFVSSSPNEDSRFALAVLRGTLALPTRAYLQIAPGVWKVEGPLTSISAREVRSAVQTAPVVVLHGDTAVFGAPRSLARGALALMPNDVERGADWYAVAAPASPLMATLGELPWDSLPPLDVAPLPPNGDWTALTVARARQLDRRSAIVGFEGTRRVVVVGASGFWRWRFRGGASAPAYTALWGSVFDWLAAGRFDARAALPAAGAHRAGEAIQWQRGTTSDSSVRVELTRRGDTTVRAPMTLRFGASPTVESAPLDPGVYEARVRGGTSVIAVNASRELLPRQPTVRSGPIGARASLAEAPRLRDRLWPFVVLLIALCAEWMLRRRAGLR